MRRGSAALNRPAVSFSDSSDTSARRVDIAYGGAVEEDAPVEAVHDELGLARTVRAQGRHRPGAGPLVSYREREDGLTRGDHGVRERVGNGALRRRVARRTSTVTPA